MPIIIQNFIKYRVVYLENLMIPSSCRMYICVCIVWGINNCDMIRLLKLFFGVIVLVC